MQLKRLLKHSYIISWICYFIGIFGLLLLSQPEINYKSGVSENALLVGVVDETFYADNDIYLLYEKFIKASASSSDTFNLLRSNLKDIGLEIYEQNFTFHHQLIDDTQVISGTNLYGILRAPSGSRTESIIITTPLRISGGSEPIVAGSYAIIIAIARQLRLQLYWAKDIIFLFPDMEFVGLQAWLDAYHGTIDTTLIRGSELSGRAGSIQAGLNLELPSLAMDSIDVSYVGVNGQLPNLDIINAISELSNKLGIRLSLYGNVNHRQDRWICLKTLLASIWSQASGSPTGLHGPLVNMQVPAVTLRGQSAGDRNSWRIKDVTDLGRLIEAFLRSLNNLQERFHQSYYYYLLPDTSHFASIGVYSPALYTMIGSLLLQLVVVFLRLFPSEGTTETASLMEISFKRETSSQPASDVSRNAESGHMSLRGFALSSLTSVGACLLAGVILNNLPTLAYALATGAPLEQRWIRAENYLLCGFLALFALFLLALPCLSKLLQSCCLGCIQEQDLAILACLFGWSLFLCCLSALNASATIVIAFLIIPTLLIVCQYRRLPRVCPVVCLLLVSPPLLLVWCQLVPAKTGLIRALSSLLIRVHLESHLIGCWSWDLGTLLFTPLWLFTWQTLFNPPHLAHLKAD